MLANNEILELKEKIRNVPDFPVKGILFRDITTLLKDSEAFSKTIELLSRHYEKGSIDIVAGIEARGYILGAPLAARLGAGFVPVRKPGKLPSEAISETYTLEYGTNTLEVHADAVQKGEKVLIVDDLIATGGSALAAKKLIERLGGMVTGFCFLIELTDLNGKKSLGNTEIYSLIQY
ncbi:MAG: adenine phosphoribosyltransferase [Firmicutes bacterium]|nr:adenine phosphoribosyltransferase [Bacillota bacterium]